MIYVLSAIFAMLGVGLLWWSHKVRVRRLQPASMVGVRTSATLASKTTWKESHAQAWTFTFGMAAVSLLMAGMLLRLGSAHVSAGAVMMLIIFGCLVMALLAMTAFVVTTHVARSIESSSASTL